MSVKRRHVDCVHLDHQGDVNSLRGPPRPPALTVLRVFGTMSLLTPEQEQTLMRLTGDQLIEVGSCPRTGASSAWRARRNGTAACPGCSQVHPGPGGLRQDPRHRVVGQPGGPGAGHLRAAAAGGRGAGGALGAGRTRAHAVRVRGRERPPARLQEQGGDGEPAARAEVPVAAHGEYDGPRDQRGAPGARHAGKPVRLEAAMRLHTRGELPTELSLCSACRRRRRAASWTRRAACRPTPPTRPPSTTARCASGGPWTCARAWCSEWQACSARSASRSRSSTSCSDVTARRGSPAYTIKVKGFAGLKAQAKFQNKVQCTRYYYRSQYNHIKINVTSFPVWSGLWTTMNFCFEHPSSPTPHHATICTPTRKSINLCISQLPSTSSHLLFKINQFCLVHYLSVKPKSPC